MRHDVGPKQYTGRESPAEEDFQLTAPILDPSASPGLPSILQGAADPAGITIAELVVDGSITDPDGEAVEAIAITGLNTQLGAWQYSLDDGATWFTIDTDRINSEVNELALHLGPTAKLRLLPFAGLQGTLEDAITFRAWDQSSGSAGREGEYRVVPVAGDAPDSSGTPSAYSQDTDTASITVEPNAELPDPVTTNRGTLLTDIGSGSYDFATSITTQADGKILVAGVGDSQFAILRYNIDGSLDTTFNGTGRLTPEFGSNDWAWEVTVQADGKILVAGTTVTSTVIARYNADGTADVSFNGSGHVINAAVGFGNSLALQSDGNMVVAGLSYSSSFDVAVGRFTADGGLDPSFNGTGVVATDVAGNSDSSRDVQVQADGKVVVLAKMEPSSDGHLGLVRYNADGSLDTTFSGNGSLLTELQATGFTGGSVSIQADGKILVAGMDATRGLADSDFALARFNADGSVDATFGVNGKVVTDLGAHRQDIVGRAILQADGKILVAGSTDVSGMDWDFALIRYNADGSLDTTFNGTGQARADFGEHSTDSAYALTVQADGKILVTGASSANGSSDFAVVRFNADGSLDKSFGDPAPTPPPPPPPPPPNTAPTFHIGTGKLVTGFAGLGTGVVIQEDGGIVVAGMFYSQPNSTFGVLRFNPDGTPDTGFNGTGSQTIKFPSGGNDAAYSVALQADGKIVVAGAALSYTGIARLNADGSLDSTWAGGGMVYQTGSFGTGLALQTDGTVLVSGIRYDLGSNWNLGLSRYTAAGTLDTSFHGTGSVSTDLCGAQGDRAESVVALPDGKALLVGLTQVGGSNVVAMVRHLADGTLDTSFNGTGVVVTALGSIPGHDYDRLALQADGKIVVGGQSGSDFALMRYNADGSPDAGFGSAGRVVTALGSNRVDSLMSVTVQADGKLVAAGSSMAADGNWDIALVRYNADGTLDASFNGTGWVLTDIAAASLDQAIEVTVQDDGKIVVVGSSVADSQYRVALLRFNADGTLDREFNSHDTLGSTTSYVENAAAVALDTEVRVYDAELAALSAGAGNYAGASITVARHGGANSQDVFSARGSLSFVGAAAVISGVTVGTVSNTAGQLTITFNGNATQARVDTVLSSLAYANSSDAPPPIVTLDFAFNDGTLAATGQVSVSIAGVNDTPTGTLGITGKAQLAQVLTANNLLADADGMGTVSYQWLSDGIAIVGADQGTLWVGPELLGKKISVRATYVDAEGQAETAVSAATAAVTVSLLGTAGADWLMGANAADSMMGLAGDDTLDGRAGGDRLAGGQGNDTYIVDSTADVITERAGEGIDRVLASVSHTLASNVEHLVLTGSANVNGTGNTAANDIRGNTGSNLLDGRAGLDALDGGEGSDIYVVALAADHPGAEFADTGSSGIDEVRFTATRASTLTLFAGDTGIEQVVIGTGIAVSAVTTGTAALNINASAVANGLSITGNAGANILIGTAFGDTLNGGKGLDTLTGGGGTDYFVFSTAGASSNRDTITDFTSGTDALQFSKTVFAAIVGSVGTLSAEQFWSSATTVSGHDADDRIIYNTTTGVLYYDADGSGGGAAVQIALIGTTTHPTIVYSDIQLIA
jgi:uncharacterized delta-60 repeat protein